MVQKEAVLTPFPVRFNAMGCPCEILLDTADADVGRAQSTAAQEEAQRIEAKYSRYRQDSLIHRVNTSGGKKIEVDAETAAILDFADSCYELSEGLFDITTGVLNKSPNASTVGWENVTWTKPFLTLPVGFEIDFGGICKEYAADRILSLLTERHAISTLVNLGGDIAAAGRKLWAIGIEDVRQPGAIVRTIHVREGGVATSGTARRGGHILHPKTRRAVEQAPESVTVATKTCTEAGFWSTLAMLQGAQAETFLNEQKLEFWCYRVRA